MKAAGVPSVVADDGGLWSRLQLWYYRIAASGCIPRTWHERRLPPPEARSARAGHLKLEVVSHCWRYASFLQYQLSSIVLFPPNDLDLCVTVYYAEEDAATRDLLARFGAIELPRVRWNWQALPREALFRRAIGRNHAALASAADWIWFTDCDLMFRENCFDSLAAALQNRRDALVFPAVESCTPLLSDTDPSLHPDPEQQLVVDIDPDRFSARRRSRATGPLQIVHGDVARACGYCDAIAYYQKPATRWQKAHEDRALRWLLGSQGVALEIAGVYRLRHASKGRYTGTPWMNRLRGALRSLVSRWQERRLPR